MLWQNYKLFLNKRCIMEEKTQFVSPAKAYLVGKYFNIILAINLKKVYNVKFKYLKKV